MNKKVESLIKENDNIKDINANLKKDFNILKNKLNQYSNEKKAIQDKTPNENQLAIIEDKNFQIQELSKKHEV